MRPLTLRLERHRQALVGEQRRVDSAREVAEVVDRVAEPALELGRHLPHAVGIVRQPLE
jgi:hypothetical protein